MAEQKVLLRTEEKEIDGIKLACTAFPCLVGLGVKARLIKLLAPALGKALKGIDGDPTDIMKADIDMGVIGEAITMLGEKLADESVTKLIMDLLSTTTIDGQQSTEAVFNFTFSQKYTSLYKALIFVIDTNRFFGERNIGDMIKGATIPTMIKATS